MNWSVAWTVFQKGAERCVDDKDLSQTVRITVCACIGETSTSRLINCSKSVTSSDTLVQTLVLTVNHRSVFFPTPFYGFETTFLIHTPGPNLHHEPVEG
jgi:hypothetical protein